MAHPSATSDSDVSATPSPLLPPVRPRPTPVPRPLAGVTCPVLTAAIRRAEERWVSDRADDEDPDGIPRALAAIGLAVDRRFPSYLLSLEVRDALDHDASEQFGAQLGGANGLDFLVQIVHDLRSPLTSILFLAETLMQERSGPVNERQQRQLGLIYSAAFGLSALTSDTIELSRGGDQLADDRPTPLSVAERAIPDRASTPRRCRACFTRSAAAPRPAATSSRARGWASR